MKKNMLRLIAVAAMAAAACAGDKGDVGPAGAPGTPGAPGAPGANGTSCSVASTGNGTSTITCTDGTSVTVRNGTNGTSCTLVDNNDGTKTLTCGDGTSVVVQSATVDFATATADEKAALDMAAVVTGVQVGDDGRPVVSFKVSNAQGHGVRGLPAANMRFALLKLAVATNGGNDTWVSYMAANATSSASTESAAATGLTDNGDGTYAYKFTKVVTDAAAAGTTYDASATHRVVMIMNASGNPYAPVNAVYDYVPATGANVDGANEKVSGAACLECHSSFRAKANGTAAFHGGARYDVRVCVACHNDQRRFTSSGAVVTEPAIDGTGAWTGNLSVVNGEAFINLPVFIHKIHMGEELTLKGGTYSGVARPYETTYPQDIRNCSKCHKDVAKAGNYLEQPSRRACGSCHDNVSFTSPAANARTVHAGSYPFDDDSLCSMCHTASGSLGILSRHQPVVAKDPNNSLDGGTNIRTNAAAIAAVGYVPAGATKLTAVLKSVQLDGSRHPQITFKFQSSVDGSTPADVTFADPTTAPDPIPNFAGTHGVYFAYAIPQDGINAPADFNATASSNLRQLWNGSATGTAAGTLTGPDSSGYYVATITGTTIPATATMLTGGLGYQYDLPVNQPLTQTNLAAYPYDSAKKSGGLIVPVADVSKVATGFTARRAIVNNSKCNACHGFLGVAPNFHVGQRNDGATCAFCHNPNRTSSGWAANAKDFVHGIHAAAKRSVPFTWHAVSATEGYYDVTYPGVLNNCEQCHNAGTYDFSASASAAALPNLLASTAATGTLASTSTSAYQFSPYVTLDNNYGAGFSASAQAAATTLVISPVTAACVSCHDDTATVAHARANGGSFYEARSTAATKVEQCMLCHSRSSIAAIADVHK